MRASNADPKSFSDYVKNIFRERISNYKNASENINSANVARELLARGVAKNGRR